MKIQKMFWNPKLIRIGPLKENTARHRGGRKYSLEHSNKFAWDDEEILKLSQIGKFLKCV